MSKAVSVNTIFDKEAISTFQIAVYALCFFIMFLDGFDMISIGVTVPLLAAHLHVKPMAIGAAISVGQFGPMIGAVMLGMLADRIGRKRTLVFSTFVFGFFTYMLSHVTSTTDLAVYRLLAGIGMGGAIPNAIALGSEYAPADRQAGMTLFMWAGMPVGAMLASFGAAWMLPHFGWKSIFIAGGVAPVVFAFLISAAMPESLHYLVKTGGDNLGKARAILAKICKDIPVSADIQLTVGTASDRKGSSVGALFTEGRSAGTILLWILFFLSFYLLWIVHTWVPTLLKMSGASVQHYSIGNGCVELGAFVAMIAIGYFMNRFNKLNLITLVFIGTFLALVAFGYFAAYPFPVILVVCMLAGFFVNGGNASLMGLSSSMYPAEMRATGIGWAYGVGKIGSVLAPVIGGLYLSMNWSVFKVSFVSGITALVIAAFVLILKNQAIVPVEGEA